MLPNQTLNAILSSLRTFDPLSDTLDILICSSPANPVRASLSRASF